LNKTLRDIWDGLRFQPARTALALLAVAIGMAALTVLLAALGGLRERSREVIEAMGTQVFAILPGAARDAELTLDQGALLAANLREATVTTLRRFTVTPPGAAGPLTLVATDGHLAAVRGWRPVRGRFLDARDAADGARVAVISAPLSLTVGWEPGRDITLREVPFTIVGVVETAGGADMGSTEELLFSGERTVFVPNSATVSWAGRDSPGRVEAILVRAPRLADLPRTLAAARRLLAQGREPDPYPWVTPDVLVQGLRRLEAVIAATAGAVAFLCILLGGTTLMSLMIANVRDRIPEIGLRRALGARPKDIALLFVTESCLVTGVAALAGTLVTHALLAALGSRFPSPIHLGAATAAIPLLVALILGGLFSFWPARLAARIAPAEALRSE